MKMSIYVYKKIASRIGMLKGFCADLNDERRALFIKDIDDAMLHIDYNKYFSDVKLDMENSNGQKLIFTGHYVGTQYVSDDKDRDFMAIVKPDLSFDISIAVKANDGKRMDVYTKENIRLAFALALTDVCSY